MRFLPFAAWMPSPDTIQSVASLPYDVLTEDEARGLAAASEDSIVHVIRPEVQFSPPHLPPLLHQYQAAAKAWEGLCERGVVHQHAAPAYYVYRLERQGHVQTGVIGLVSTADYEANRVRKHELTRPDKELDRTRHMDIVGAQLGLVYLAYRSTSTLDELLVKLMAPEPDLHFSLGPVTHDAWIIDDEASVAAVATAMDEVDVFYIADGHHRAAAAARVAHLRATRADGAKPSPGFAHFVCAAFGADQLLVLPYNRVVRDLGGRTAEQFLDAVGERFLVRPARSAAPPSPGRVCMYVADRWYEIEPLPGQLSSGDPVGNLDVAMLQALLLEPILGITDPRRDPRIDFVGGIKPLDYLERLVDRGTYAVAFSMFATQIDDVMRVADSNREMPPKSTWFEPKLASGVFVHVLDGVGPSPDEHAE